jgi:hypothetical protein
VRWGVCEGYVNVRVDNGMECRWRLGADMAYDNEAMATLHSVEGRTRLD